MIESPASETLVAVSGLTYLCFLYLLTALIVERTMEIVMAAFKYTELRRNWFDFWNSRAEAVRRRLDTLFRINGLDASQSDRELSWMLWRLIVPTDSSRKDVIPADLIRGGFVRAGSQLLAFGLSLWIVYGLLPDPKELCALAVKSLPGVGFFADAPGWEHVRRITLAVAISIGTDPLHQLIGTIEQNLKSGSGKKGAAS